MFDLQEMNAKLATARGQYLSESSAQYLGDVVKFLEGLKPLKPEHYEGDSIKDTVPAGYVSKKLLSKMKPLAKKLKEALPLKQKIDAAKTTIKENEKALEKHEKYVFKVARLHRDIGGSKTYDYHESGHGGGVTVYTILDGLAFSGLG